jgi:hypothetical protein
MSQRIVRLALAVVILSPSAAARADDADDKAVVAPSPRPVVFASVESSLATGGNRIRQYAFDGNRDTSFTSEKKAAKDDHFTLRFEHPVLLNSASVIAGYLRTEHLLQDGVLEVSGDGVMFEPVAKFSHGAAQMKGSKEGIRAIRIRVTADCNQPLVVNEFTLDTNPRVVTFRHPIEFTLDVADAPEMKEWGEKVIRVCERQYPFICDELASPGFVPTTQIRLTLKNDYAGVAAASGSKITGSVKYFKSKPDDIGAMVHETVHCVQLYRGRNIPGWLVEGIADYIRFWRFEPGKAGRLTPERAKYDGSYRTTAAFLAFVSDKYDPNAVSKLNAALRENKYDVGIWKTLTGKSVEELNQEWRQSLAK